MTPRPLHCSFGPVPSRRLGRSLGINNIPSKVCSYSCVYCQVGRTRTLTVDRRPFFPAGAISLDVERRVDRTASLGQSIDYLTFVADGEPTLDSELSREITLLRRFALPIAVITNGSLLGRADVRDELSQAEWVSVKVDTVSETVWRRINRPHPSLRLKKILDGIGAFAEEFPGTLTTETMLVRGLNDRDLEPTANFIGTLQPRTAYLGVPTRPPAEKWVRPPSEEALVRAYELFAGRIEHVECLAGYEGNAFTAAGNAEAELLSVTAVHPMREQAVRALLSNFDAPWQVVDDLLSSGKLATAEYEGHTFYVRKWSRD